MQHYRSLDGIHLHKPWLTIGSFDGVHRGHQALVRNLVESAHAEGSQAAVLTFHPHPAVVLRGIKDPYYLTSPEERARLLGELGLDAVITLEFTPQLAALSAREFMQRLAAATGLSHLWVGFNFALGRGREGDVPTLRHLGEELGYRVHVQSPITLDGEVVSSSHVRGLLAHGDVDQAAEMLGRYYGLEGKVVHGDGRGHDLGFPTANLDLWPSQMLPAAGIYATWTRVGERYWPSVSNVGVRPTFETGPVVPRVEAYILGFKRALYGQQIRVEFVRYLREERRFASIEALVEQMQVDVQQAEEIFTDEYPAPGLST